MTGKGSGTRWWRVSFPAPARAEGFRVVEALHGLGAREIWRADGRVHAHLPHTEHPDESGAVDGHRTRIVELRAALSSATSIPPALLERELTVKPIHANMVGRTGVSGRPIRVTERLAVRTGGGHDPAPITVELGPGAAFGSPEHPTTRACLRLLDGRVDHGDRLVDVGTGSGILAVAGALLGASRVEALESDPVACGIARENVARNGVGDRVRVTRELVTIRTLRLRRDAPNGVLANLVPSVLMELAPGLTDLPRSGGWLVVSGVPRSDLDPVRTALLVPGVRCVHEEVDEGWWTALLERS